MARHWAARVIDVEDGRVAIELRTLHEEAGPPDATPVFALSLLLEHWWRVVRQRDVTRDFRENLSPDPSSTDAQLAPLHELAFGSELEVGRDEHDEARRTGRLRGRAVIGSGSFGPRTAPRYRVTLEGDRAALERAAQEIVHDVQAVDAIHPESTTTWSPDAPPRVTLRFTIVPPELVSFLHAGMTWETTIH